MERLRFHPGTVPHDRKGTRVAFTLIELLVVIAITAVLASILFPVFAQARAKARQIGCLSNMNQISKALMMYTQDYDEVLPGNHDPDAGFNQPLGFMEPPRAGNGQTYRNWARDVQPYVKNLKVFICPGAVPYADTRWAGWIPSANPGAGNTNYFMNGVVADIALAAVQQPADIIYLHEEKVITRAAQERPRKADPASRNLFTEANWANYDLTHNQGANLLFCDGHAKWQKKTAIAFKQFGMRGGDCGTNGETRFSDEEVTAVTQGGYECQPMF